MAIRTVTVGPRVAAGGGGGEPPYGKATFGIGIGAPQPVGNEITPRYMVRKVGGAFFEALANARIAPDGAPLYIDIQKSIDEGASWHSIFPDGNQNKIVIPDGSTSEVRVTVFAAAPNHAVAIGDWLRPCLLEGSAENAQDIEITALWE